MFCINCGHELPEINRFCEHCGTKIEKSEFQVYNYYDQREISNRRILKKLSRRIGINAIIWMLIGLNQVLSAGYGLLGNGDMSGIDIILLGILGVVNCFGGFVDLICRNNIFEDRKGIIEEHRICSNNWNEYVWNGFVGVACLISGDYFFMSLSFLAIITDFFFVKLYVFIHKKEFCSMEEEQLLQEQLANENKREHEVSSSEFEEKSPANKCQ